MEPQKRPVVAVVQSDRRRAAVAQALCLIEDQVQSVIKPQVVLKPNLVSHRRQLPSTHADALAATLDAIMAAGAKSVTIAEGASDATAGFDRFGYKPECHGRPVRFFDINRDEHLWDDIELHDFEGQSSLARVSRTITGTECRVSLALMKTHVISQITCSLKNMLSSVHPADRPLMHGNKRGGNGFSGWRKLVVEFLKGDGLLVNGLTRSMGRLRRLKHLISGLETEHGFERLSASDLRFLRSVETLNRNLATLSTITRPHLSVVDGFDAMHREGPRHGTPIRLGLAVAGTDPVAVDCVVAALMGFDPSAVGYLQYAESLGIGVADLDQIEVIGDPIAQVARRCVPHSNTSIAKHWKRLRSDSAIPKPHFGSKHEPARS